MKKNDFLGDVEAWVEKMKIVGALKQKEKGHTLFKLIEIDG